MATYSTTDKFLHKLYLGNYPLSRAALEMEEIMFGAKRKKISIKEMVFVTGLARSGTTAVMNRIFETGEYASLQYSNMPFVLSPNLWKRDLKIASHERAHNDGIIIDGNSPEEFDEYFWKAHLNDTYIKTDGLALHEVSKEVLEKYLTYVGLICLAKGRDKYVSKNNNNVLRLDALEKIDRQKIILLFREPVAHASSLMKLDKRFSEDQEKDPFSLKYFDYLGHHEFGLHHKPFLLTESFGQHRNQYDKESLNYWLAIWLNYYSYILSRLKTNMLLICFEDLISYPKVVYGHINNQLNLQNKIGEVAPHTPSSYEDVTCDPELLAACQATYEALRKERTYRLDN